VSRSCEFHPAALAIDALLRECEVSRTRRGGPGGQHRNKVETAVVVRHRPTGATGQASERRSQDLNRQTAVQRLRVQLALDVRREIVSDETPSALWLTRARGRKLAVSSEHADFPALLAEALDRLAAADWDAAKAAAALGITATQLVKFLQQEPLAMQQLNEARLARGLRALR
jgi:hypothetical protein